MRVILKKTVEAKINEAIEAIQDKDTIDYVELTRAEIAELAKEYPFTMATVLGGATEQQLAFGGRYVNLRLAKDYPTDNLERD